MSKIAQNAWKNSRIFQGNVSHAILTVKSARILGHANSATSGSIYGMMSACFAQITVLLAGISHNAQNATRCFIKPSVESVNLAQRTARSVRMKQLVYLAISHIT